MVQIADYDVPDWGEAYRREALEGKGAIEHRELGESMVDACLSLSSEVGGMEVRVDHFLLRLSRR